MDWFVRRDAARPSADEQAAFTRWLADDPAHRDAYAEIDRMWGDLDGLSASTGAAPDPKRLAHPIKRPVALAAVAGLCGLVLLAIGLDLPVRWRADAVSGIGQVRTVTLPDGSTAVLNTASAIEIDYAADARRIRLLRGEAEFTVARNAHRPFSVAAEGGVSTARGTVFTVRRRAAGATVTVLENRVGVAHRDGGRAELGRGQRVTYAAGRGLGAVETVDSRAAGAWRRGKLIFVDTRLSAVIDELNRYHVGQVRLLDGALHDRRVNGVFEIRDPVAVVDALEASLGLTSTRLTDLLILLHQ